MEKRIQVVNRLQVYQHLQEGEKTLEGLIEMKMK